jgi:hypothetical protein
MNEPPALKPMTVVQILDASFRLYRENFFLFVGIIAVPFVPITIIMIASMAFLFATLPEAEQGDAFQALLLQPAPQQETVNFEHMGTFLIAFLVMMGFFLLLYLIAIPIARGALTRAVSDRYLGRPASFGDSYRAVFAIFWRYLGTTLLVGLVVGLGFIFCIVPGIVLFTLFAFVPMIMIVENLAGTDSMGRSKDLSAGHRGRIFGLAVLNVLIAWFLSAILSMIFDVLLPLAVDSPVLLQTLSFATSQILQLLLEPIWTLAFILLYYDVRIRKEAFDLHLLAVRSAQPA